MKKSLLLALFGVFLALLSTSVRFADASEPMMCTMQYAPVCGSVEVQCVRAPCYPVRQTFGNSCMAQSSNATNVTEGECQTPPTTGGKMSARQALQVGTWEIVSLNGVNITSSGTLTFGKNTFSAKLCNNLSGQYHTVGGMILTRKTISTMMYCDSDIMDVEDAMRFNIGKYMVGDENLTIKTRHGDTIIWKKQK